MLLSATVLRFATIALVAGIIIFTSVGLAGRTGGVSVGDTILVAVVWGGPISAVLGVIVGLVWEKLVRPVQPRATSDVSGEASGGRIERPPKASARRRSKRHGRRMISTS